MDRWLGSAVSLGIESSRPGRTTGTDAGGVGLGLGSLWTTGCALFGFVVWATTASASASGLLPLGAIETLFLLAPLVAMPLALDLAAGLHPRPRSTLLDAARLLQPLAALMALLSFLLPPGLPAASLACGWLLVATCGGLSALDGAVGAAGKLFGMRGSRSRGDPASALSGRSDPGESDARVPCPEDRSRADGTLAREARLETICTLAGLLYFWLAGLVLVLTRAGATPGGFVEPIVLLTALHYHYAGFAAAILAAATTRQLHGGSIEGPVRAAPLSIWTLRLAAPAVVTGPALLGAGWTLHVPVLKLAAVALLAAGHAGLCLVVCALLPSIRPLPARLLLALSSTAAAMGMFLAVVYAIGEFGERFSLSIPQMARLHGPANGIGYVLCGLAGWCLAASGRSEVRRGGTARGRDADQEKADTTKTALSRAGSSAGVFPAGRCGSFDPEPDVRGSKRAEGSPGP